MWENLRPDLLDALFTPFPPVRSGLRLAVRLRGTGGLRMARTLVLPVRRMAEEEFAARAADCCWRATPCTPTSRPRPPAAAASAG